MSNKVMSFTQIVKEEICRNDYTSKERIRALLAAYIRINGTMIFRDKKEYLSLSTENAKIARFIYQIVKSTYLCETHLSYHNTKRGNTTYEVLIDETNISILDDLEISFLEGKISKNIVKNDDTISGYLAGAFLASGSCNSPHTSNYHLELCVNSENYAKWLSKLFGKYKNSDIEPKIALRRDKYIIYFKKSDQIANFLIMIGAVESCMEFENVRIDRDIMNSANRLTNIDTANMKKRLETSKRQIKEIQHINEMLGIENIENEKTRLLCRLRLENEEASMLELAEMMSEELGHPVTKSNINHIFRSIHEMFVRFNGHED